MPARCAASTFSFSPPIGSTFPRSVTSPVIATSHLTGAPSSADTSAVLIAIPADGPSLGVAPAGTCRWILLRANAFGCTPSSCAADRANESAARADSLITRPRFPVCEKAALPSIHAASTCSNSPPYGVTASPFTSPTMSSFRSSSGTCSGRPNMSSRSSAVTVTDFLSPSAIHRAAFRHNAASILSRFRTPASRV